MSKAYIIFLHQDQQNENENFDGHQNDLYSIQRNKTIQPSSIYFRKTSEKSRDKINKDKIKKVLQKAQKIHYKKLLKNSAIIKKLREFSILFHLFDLLSEKYKFIISRN